MRQLDRGSGKTRHAYLGLPLRRARRRGPPIVVFDYQTSRAGAHARAFLHGWRGDLMLDDYVGHKAIFAEGRPNWLAWANIRRKFFDMHAASDSAVAETALSRIAALYTIEQQGAGLNPPQQLRCARNWPYRYWPYCMPGCWRLSVPPAAAQPRPSTTRSSAGRRWNAMSIRAHCRSVE